MKIILASQSPRRKQLMLQLGLVFDVEPSDYIEDMTLELEPHPMAKIFSRGKAESVADRHTGEDVLVVGSDTFVYHEGEKMGKPHTPELARHMLRQLSGKTHQVITGYTVIDCKTGKNVTRSTETAITFKQLTDEDIEGYIATGEPLERAGGYAVQERGAVFIERIDGDFFATVGLPIASLAETLKEFGVDVFAQHLSE